MYCQYFGLAEKPFDITPDQRFLFPTEGHREALASLLYGIRERRGLIALTGPPGTGKTTLLRAAIARLNRKTKWAFIFNTDLPFLQLLAMILDDLGILRMKGKLTKFAALRKLQHYAIKQTAAGGNLVIFIDEAQNLSANNIENLRLLSNVESSRRKMIQIVLSGQSELDSRLNRKELHHFVQRISLRRLVRPLTREQTRAYINYRLKVSRFSGRSLFNNGALDMIWQYSGGVPRVINIICDNAMINAFGVGKKLITEKVIEEVVTDMSYRPRVANVEDSVRQTRRSKVVKLR